MRKSPINVQMIPESTRAALFGEENPLPSKYTLSRIRTHLSAHGLADSVSEPIPELHVPIPALLGEDLAHHMMNLATDVAEPYLSLAHSFASAELPPMPAHWVTTPGWHRYGRDGSIRPCFYPEEAAFVFDVETPVTTSQYPVMACAVSEEAWYSWTSTSLYAGANQMVPLGDEFKLVIAHSASYDKARVKETYRHELNKVRYMDTMALHMCIGGISTKQRRLYQKYHNSENTPGVFESWMEFGTLNSLKDVYKLYCGGTLMKDARDIFVKGSLQDIRDEVQKLFTYCALDCKATHEVFAVTFPRFRRACPHPATFAGMLIMGTTYLPINQSWNQYKADADRVFTNEMTSIEVALLELANSAKAQAGTPESFQDDPWLQQLDWSVNPKTRVRKGLPEWYRDLFKGDRLHLTVKSRVTPYLLRLKWLDFPLQYLDKRGWGYVVPRGQEHDAATPKVILPNGDWYKLPHKDGDESNCGNPLAKAYLSELENGVLNSDLPLAAKALNTATACSYWASVQSRVKGLLTVFNQDGTGAIIPQMCVAGTVTRRATENTFLTASSAKKNRIGSEIKAMIKVPPGYKRVGADIDA